MRKKRVAALVTALILAGSYVLFFLQLSGFGADRLLADRRALLLYLLPIALLVQLIKAFRAYLIFVDTSLSMADSFLYYAQSTIVSVILPMKLGELFRIYRFGAAIGDYIGGLARILADRLVDTAALLLYLTAVLLSGSHSVFAVYIVLAAFSALLCACWIAFPSTHRFGNDYLITRRHSEKAHRALEILERGKHIHAYLRELFRGKLFLMFLLSLAAWGLELMGVALFMRGGISDGEQIGNYLQSALAAGDSELQKLYAVAYVFVLTVWMLLWLTLRLVKMKRRPSDADHRSL